MNFQQNKDDFGITDTKKYVNNYTAITERRIKIEGENDEPLVMAPTGAPCEVCP